MQERVLSFTCALVPWVKAMCWIQTINLCLLFKASLFWHRWLHIAAMCIPCVSYPDAKRLLWPSINMWQAEDENVVPTWNWPVLSWTFDLSANQFVPTYFFIFCVFSCYICHPPWHAIFSSNLFWYLEEQICSLCLSFHSEGKGKRFPASLRVAHRPHKI